MKKYNTQHASNPQRASIAELNARADRTAAAYRAARAIEHPLELLSSAIIIHAPADSTTATIYQTTTITHLDLPISAARAANLLADIYPGWWLVSKVAPTIKHLFLDFSGQSLAASNLPADAEWFVIPYPPAGHHDPDAADRVHLIEPETSR